MSNDRQLILCCGTEAHFPRGYDFTADLLQRLQSETSKCQQDEEIVGMSEQMAHNLEIRRAAEHDEDFDSLLSRAVVIVPFMTRITAERIAKAEACRLIIQYGVGIEGVDMQAATAAGIYVANIPSDGTGNAQSCAEHSIYLAMSLYRQPTKMADALAAGHLGTPCGETLYGATVCLVGLGGIGKQLARRLLAFGVNRLIILTRQANDESSAFSALESCGESLRDSEKNRVNFVSWDDFWKNTNVECLTEVSTVFLTCSQNKETMGLVNKDFLARFTRPIFLVNIARGGIIDYEAVAEGLSDGRVAGVGIDVFREEPFPKNDPFLSLPGVISTPHVAGVTRISYANMSRYLLRAVRQLLDGETPDNIRNCPDIPK